MQGNNSWIADVLCEWEVRNGEQRDGVGVVVVVVEDESVCLEG